MMQNDLLENVKEKEQEIRNLASDLSSTSSDVGDWKISKCMEYQLVGAELPYDMQELHEKRQRIRDRINVLEEEIIKATRIINNST